MISNNRAHYSSGDEFLSALKQDESWLSQLKHLQNSTDDARTLRDKANEKIGKGYAYHFWDIYNHQVEPVVRELWNIDEFSMPKLKIQTIGMLSMEWLEQHTELGKETSNEPPAECLITQTGEGLMWTCRARLSFQKAVTEGWMIFKNGKYSWCGVKPKPNGKPSKSELAYFLGKVYGYKFENGNNVGAQLPASELNDYFGFGKKSVTDTLLQLYRSNNEQPYRSIIDDFFSTK